MGKDFCDYVCRKDSLTYKRTFANKKIGNRFTLRSFFISNYVVVIAFGLIKVPYLLIYAVYFYLS